MADNLVVPEGIAREAVLPAGRRIQWILVRTIRWGVHAGALIGILAVGVSWTAFGVFLLSTAMGLLGITLCYHRFFAHHAFATSRWFQFLLALWGASALQRGPIWWAAVHRHHHRYSDTDRDWHSPIHGFWHAHMGWLESPRILDVSYEAVGDLTRYPELRLVDTFYHLPALALIAILAYGGSALASHHPELGTDAWQLVIWGFFVRTVVTGNVIFAVNSVLHSWGRRRYATRDNSRNSYWLGLLSFGDGFHNNHHRFAASARHGFFPWEIDITFYVIRLFERLGLVWNVRTPPARILAEGRASRNGGQSHIS